MGQYDNGTETTFDRIINVTLENETASCVVLVPVQVAENVRYSDEKKTLIQSDVDNETLVIQGEYAVNNAVLQWYSSIGAGVLGEKIPIVPPSTGGDEVVNPDGPNFPNLG